MTRSSTSALLMIFSLSLNASELDRNTLDDAPVILSATKLEQSVADVPASVSVITSDQIRRLGIQNIPDALRLVPGMLITQSSAHDYRINYHGTNGLEPRRMQILIDGVSVYRNGLARIDWYQLPIPIENIERIEVTRSPSGSTYGSNSFQSVINIISKSPDSLAGFEASLLNASQSTNESYFRYGSNIKDTSISFSIKQKRAGGFDHNFTQNPNQERTLDSRDDTELTILNFNSSTFLSDTEELVVNASYTDVALEWEYAGGSELTFPDSTGNDQLLDIKYINDISDKHEIQLTLSSFRGEYRQEWRTCSPGIALTKELRELYLSNPQYADIILSGGLPSGGTSQDDLLAFNVFKQAQLMGSSATDPACGNVNHDIDDMKSTFEIQDTYVFNDTLRAVSALGYEYYFSDSQTFLGGKVDHERTYFFSNAEYKPSKFITINAGLMVEHESTLSDVYNVSPRVALNYHFDPDHTVKFIYSEGRRTPDILETDRSWSYHVTDVDPLIDGSDEADFYILATPTVKLESEEIKSHEIIFSGRYLNYSTYDIKFFYEELDYLISEKLSLFNYHPSNNNNTLMKGVELETLFSVSHHLSLQLGYSYIDTHVSNFYEKTLHANHSGFISTTYAFPYLTASLSYYGHSGVGGNSLDKIELNLSDRYLLSDTYSIYWNFKVSHLFSDSISVTEFVGQKALNSYSEDTHYLASVGIRY